MKGDWQDHYPYFEANQVLTNEHLNELSDFLDQQNRISRLQLAGIGIGCGLTFSLNGARDKLTVYEGFGISSEGYLICLEGELPEVKTKEEDPTYNEYIKYRVYTDPSHDQYWWNPPENAPVQIELFELLTETQSQKLLIDSEAEADDIEELSDAPADFFDGKILVLYLELYDKSLRSCVGNDCDNKGQDRFLRPKLLLADKDALAEWTGVHCRNELAKVEIDSLTIYEDSDLPTPMALPRFSSGLADSGIGMHQVNAYSQISTGYANALSGYPAAMENAIEKAFTEYGGFLGLTDKGMNLVEALSTFTQTAASAQYDHDFFKDLTDAYNEFISLARDLKRDCFNENYVFCRHLMVGTPVRDPDFNTYTYDRYRNYFVSTPITPSQDQKFRKAQMLFERMLQMITGFQAIVFSGAAEGVWTPAIIPSQENQYPLGKGAIPDYYNKNNNVGNLYRVWDPDLSLKELENYVPAFDHAEYSGTVPDVVTHPLKYNLDAKPFFRIESVLGRPFDTVLNALQTAAGNHCLPFKVIALRLAENIRENEIDYQCYFRDLHADWILLRQELTCMLADLEGCIPKELLDKVEQSLELEYDISLEFYTEELTKARKTLNSDSMWDFFGAGSSGQSDFEKLGEALRNLEQVAVTFYLFSEYYQGINLNRYLDLCELPQSRGREQELMRWMTCVSAFLKSCAFARLVAMSAIFERRLARIKAGHTAIFKNFAQKHPGMEHLGGVPKGGTFIVVYEDIQPASKKKILADFTLPYLCCNDCPPIDMRTGEEPEKIPPVAKPDYLLVDRGEEVEMDVLLNDIDPGNVDPGTFKITDLGVPQIPSNGSPFEEDPNVVETDDGLVIRFKVSNNELKGDPYMVRFDYTVANTETGLSSKTTVYVLVKEPAARIIHAENDFAVGCLGSTTGIYVLDNDCFDQKRYGGVLELVKPGPTPLGNEVAVAVDRGGAQFLRYKANNPGQDVFEYRISYPSGESDTATVRVTICDPCQCCNEFRIFDTFGVFGDLMSPAEIQSNFELRLVVNGLLTKTPITFPIDMMTHLAVTTVALDTKNFQKIRVDSARSGPYKVKYAVVEVEYITDGEKPTENLRVIRYCTLEMYDLRLPDGQTGGTATGDPNAGTATTNDGGATDIGFNFDGFDGRYATHAGSALLVYEVERDMKDDASATAVASGEEADRYAAKYREVFADIKTDIQKAETDKEKEILINLYAETVGSLVKIADFQNETKEGDTYLQLLDEVNADLKELKESGVYDASATDGTFAKKLNDISFDSKNNLLKTAVDGMTKLG